MIMKDPFQRYTHEDIEKMSLEEYGDLLDEHNEYVRQKYSHINEAQTTEPEFETLEEMIKYYNAKPWKDVLNSAYQSIGS